MAWTAPMTFVTGAVLPAAQLNTYLAANFNETAVAKASTAGRYFGVDAANSIGEREIKSDIVSTSETTTNSAFVDLATVGPGVTVYSGAKVVVLLSAGVSNNTVGATSNMSVDLNGSGSSTAFALRVTSSTANALYQTTFVDARAASGVNSWTAKYATSAGTATFVTRRITVMPF